MSDLLRSCRAICLGFQDVEGPIKIKEVLACRLELSKERLDVSFVPHPELKCRALKYFIPFHRIAPLEKGSMKYLSVKCANEMMVFVVPDYKLWMQEIRNCHRKKNIL